MSEKFTQGEWVVNETTLASVNCNKKHIAMVNFFNSGKEDAVTEKECIANAHLISAAPDMYAELKKLIKEINDLSSVEYGEYPCTKKAENILAKARSE